ELTHRAREATGMAIAWLSLFDADGERLIARDGIDITRITRAQSFALGGAEKLPLYVEDALGSRLKGHPLVAGAPHARSIASVGLAASDGALVGSLTLLDPSARAIPSSARMALANLASLAIARLEARGAADLTPPRDASSEAPGDSRDPEEQLALEMEFSNAVIDMLSGAFFLVAADGKMLRWNARMGEVTGYGH